MWLVRSCQNVPWQWLGTITTSVLISTIHVKSQKMWIYFKHLDDWPNWFWETLAQTLAKSLTCLCYCRCDSSGLSWVCGVRMWKISFLKSPCRLLDFNIERAERGIIYVGWNWQNCQEERERSSRDVSRRSATSPSRLSREQVPPRQGGRKHPQQEMIQVDTKNILYRGWCFWWHRRNR